MKVLAVGGPLNGQFLQLSERSVTLTVSTEKRTYNYELIEDIQGKVLMLKEGAK